METSSGDNLFTLPKLIKTGIYKISSSLRSAHRRWLWNRQLRVRTILMHPRVPIYNWQGPFPRINRGRSGISPLRLSAPLENSALVREARLSTGMKEGVGTTKKIFLKFGLNLSAVFLSWVGGEFQKGLWLAATCRWRKETTATWPPHVHVSMRSRLRILYSKFLISGRIFIQTFIIYDTIRFFFYK